MLILFDRCRFDESASIAQTLLFISSAQPLVDSLSSSFVDLFTTALGVEIKSLDRHSQLFELCVSVDPLYRFALKEMRWPRVAWSDETDTPRGQRSWEHVVHFSDALLGVFERDGCAEAILLQGGMVASSWIPFGILPSSQCTTYQNG
jgi:hypothetical protein